MRALVTAACAAAQALGLCVGMPVSKAQAMVPDLQVMPHDPAADAASLERLALWVLQRVPPIVAVDPPDGVAEFIPVFHYRLCGVKGIDPDDTRACDHWREAAEGMLLDVSGDYRYRVRWPDGRQVRSSFRYVHQKDRMLHVPVRDCLLVCGWAEEAALFPG